jgi:nicotinamidase-related amidase
MARSAICSHHSSLVFNQESAMTASAKTALLVIDVQASFTQRPYYTEDGKATYLAAQNALIAHAKTQGWAIVRVFHTEPCAPSTNVWSMASGFVRPLDGLSEFDASATFYKSRHSALVGSGLDVWLTERGMGHLVVSGIRTEQCCETTTRHASDLGWQVTYASDATWTWPMTTPSGQVLSAADLRERTATVLQDRFAQVRSVADITAS